MFLHSDYGASVLLYAIASVPLELAPAGLPYDQEGGASSAVDDYDNAVGESPVDGAGLLDIGSDELPWENGLITFVLLSRLFPLVPCSSVRLSATSSTSP